MDLEQLSYISVIAMCTFVIGIYGYVYISVRKIKSDVHILNNGASNFIATGHKTYEKMGKTIQELQDKLTIYFSDEPAQHLTKSYIMALSALGAPTLKGYDEGTASQIKLARRGLKSPIKEAVQEALENALPSFTGGAPAGAEGELGIGNVMGMLSGDINPAQIAQMLQNQNAQAPAGPAGGADKKDNPGLE